MRRLVVAAMALLAACGGDNPAAPLEVVGGYRLALVDGQPIPVAVTIVIDPSAEIVETIRELSGGVFSIHAEAEFSFSLIYRSQLGNSPAQLRTNGNGGSFTRSGNTLTVDLGTLLGTRTVIAGRSEGKKTLTIDAGRFGVLVYREYP